MKSDEAGDNAKEKVGQRKEPKKKIPCGWCKMRAGGGRSWSFRSAFGLVHLRIEKAIENKGNRSSHV